MENKKINSKDYIIVKGAKENNLKNVNIAVPKNKFVVFTGVSGSGKTSLAFDTIFEEGKRRYIESLNSYARQFLGGFSKPNVENIEGLQPAISIDQKQASVNPRSTVGTVTEIYDFLRLLYSRCAIPYDPKTNKPLTKQTIVEMRDKLLRDHNNTKAIISAPVFQGKKGTLKKELDDFLKKGYTRVIIDKKLYNLDMEDDIQFDKNIKHNVDVVIDRVVIKKDNESRIYTALENGCNLANSRVDVILEPDTDSEQKVSFNQKYTASDSNFTIPELEPRLFSFNTPIGACPNCNGLGLTHSIEESLVIDETLPLLSGGIIPYRNNNDLNLASQEIEIVCKYYKIEIDTPIRDIPRKYLDFILYGSDEEIVFNVESSSGNKHSKKSKYEGVIKNLERRYIETTSEFIRTWIENYMVDRTCDKCQGKRLNEQALCVKIDKKSIIDICELSILKLKKFLEGIPLSAEQLEIAKLILTEINDRLEFLIDVGLGYLTLMRKSNTLSGGESQRIRLATQIGSKLSGVLYVLDEPSIGLHQKDNEKLINSLLKMRDLGNSLIVVEHDLDTMRACDYLVDIGPGAGVYGGEVVSAGTPECVSQDSNSITGEYLSGKKVVPYPKERRKNINKDILIVQAQENNLKAIDVKIPLSNLTVVTGVSGSGKSTLINQILLKYLQKKINKSKEPYGKCATIMLPSTVNRVIDVSQAPIGRTPRSNPATYTGVFDDIRDIFAKTNEAQIRGYSKSRFSFNIKGGRCESCGGDGIKRIRMHFLPDVYVNCDACNGARYNKDTLDILYKGKTIANILDMPIKEASEFFSNIPAIESKLQILNSVGLGYIKLGQSSTTLSGGEAQRVKLASELYKKISANSIYIMDEPTTGLHSDDVKKLMQVINNIVDLGATVIIIEHNLDIIMNADYIIDLGPDGGDEGGYVVCSGSPEEVAKNKKSYTAKYIKEILNQKRSI